MIDLHMRSKYSDETDKTPTEIVMEGMKRGITVQSLIDDNCGAGNREAVGAAQKLGVFYIPGIALSSTFEGRTVKVLGYEIPYDYEDFDRLDQEADNVEYAASLERLCRTQELGFTVTEKDMWELAANRHHPGNWTGRMFAQVLLRKEKHICDSLLRGYEEESGDTWNACEKSEGTLDTCEKLSRILYSREGLCYVRPAYPDLREIINLIHKSGGVAVISCENEEIVRLKKSMGNLIRYGIDYMETSKHHYVQVNSGSHALTQIQSIFG